MWDRLVTPRTAAQRLPTIYYDQICRLCRDAVTILTCLLRLEACALLPGQSQPEMEALMREDNCWVVQTADGRRTEEVTAFLQLCRASPWAHRLCRPLAWCTPLGTRLYRLMSHDRRSAWRLLNALRGDPADGWWAPGTPILLRLPHRSARPRHPSATGCGTWGSSSAGSYSRRCRC